MKSTYPLHALLTTGILWCLSPLAPSPALHAQEADETQLMSGDNPDQVIILQEMEEPLTTAGADGLEVEELIMDDAATPPTAGAPPAVLPDSPQLAADMDMGFIDNGVMMLEFPTGPEIEATAGMDREDTISIDFPDEEVRTIIRNVADLYDLNVVIPDTLVGNTSVKLRNVSWQQVFEVILDPLGYTYIEDRNIIKVRNREDLAREPLDTRVYVVQHAIAREIQPVLAPLIDTASGGRLQVDQRTNVLIITERPSRINEIGRLIADLDKISDQVMIESKFIEVTDRDTKNIGVNWASLDGYTIGVSDINRSYGRERTGLQSTEQIRTGTGSTTTATTINNQGATSTFTDTASSGFNDIATSAFTAATGRLDTAVFSADAFNIILSALQTSSDVRLVSNPTVVTMDGQLARIRIEEIFPTPQLQFNPETGTFEQSGTEDIEIGIRLDVTPQVSRGGFIHLNIKPVVSNRTGTTNIRGAEFPIIATREVETQVMIKDGFTIALGGLMEDEITNNDTKVPLLGNIPLLGRFFSSEGESRVARNLIVFVTAKTLNPDGTTYREIVDPRMLRRMNILESQVPGYELPTAERQLMEETDRALNDFDMLEKRLALEARLQQLQLQRELESEPAPDSASPRRPASRAR